MADLIINDLKINKFSRAYQTINRLQFQRYSREYEAKYNEKFNPKGYFILSMDGEIIQTGLTKAEAIKLCREVE